MENTIADNIARNIKQLRQIRGLTQDQLAKVSGVPRPTWANLESGSANPTVSILAKVALSLQVSVEELISPPKAAVKLYRAAELKKKQRFGVTVRKLLPDILNGVNLERMEFAPGSRMIGIPHRTGTREYLACESGRIELVISAESFRLEPGDVVVFRGDQKHSYLNTSSKPAVAYSTILLNP